MNRLKKILSALHGKGKSELFQLYNSKYSVCQNESGKRLFIQEKEKIFSFEGVEFYFESCSNRNSERLILNVVIKSIKQVNNLDKNLLVAVETYLLWLLYEPILDLSNLHLNKNKNIREKSQFFIQKPNENILKRSGIFYDEQWGGFVLRIDFRVPLQNAISINGKGAIKAIKELIHLISEKTTNYNTNKLERYIDTYRNELLIREYLKNKNYQVFVANGSILPRYSTTSTPLANSVPFVSPVSLEEEIELANGEKIKGMLIKSGITIIAGGGYSGKSTLLDSIELGIYNHIPGDGREYVITNANSLRTDSEDGRVVYNVNIRPFFNHIPNNSDLSDFTTSHASGSVSQATNIIEAINANVDLLLIDEDKSATNFMIKDRIMREIVSEETIIPFTDRLLELKNMKKSIITVIGGSSEYLKYADTVLLMENYIANDISSLIKKKINEDIISAPETNWEFSKSLIKEENNKEFLYLNNIEIINEKNLIIDDCLLNANKLTAILNEYQMNSIALGLENILTNEEEDIDINDLIKKLYITDIRDKVSFIYNGEFKFFEEIRELDLYNAVNRMTGIKFKKIKGGEIIVKN